MSDDTTDYGRVATQPGSREPSPSSTGLGPSGFDPSRMDESEAIEWLKRKAERARDWHYKCQEEVIAFQQMEYDYTLFLKKWEEREEHARWERRLFEALLGIVKDRDEWREQHDNLVYVRQADLAAVAIAMEARQGGDGETRLHPKDDSAGPKDIAHEQ